MTSATWTFYVVLTTSLVLYVYRFAVAGVNLSLFRTVFLAWLAVFAVDVVRGRIRPSRTHAPFLVPAVLIAVINVIDFASLGGYPTLRRDIANHLVNIAFSGLVLMYVDTQAKITGLLRAFAWSSVVTSAVAVYAGTFNRLPFESLIRAFGSAQGRALVYVNDDAAFERATSTFFDPNIYGIYTMLVLGAIIYLWLQRPSRVLAALFAVNMVCLSMTLSRTGVAGTLALLAIVFVLSARSRWFAVASAVSTVALLYLATGFQSYATYDRMRNLAAEQVREWQEWWASGAESTTAARSVEGGGPVAAPPRRGADGGSGQVQDEVQGRLTNARSLEERMAFIQRGQHVFWQRPLLGSGSAALTTPDVPLSTAHLTYLTLLARYGIVGTAVYLAFLVMPLALVWLRPAPPAARLLVSIAILPLMVVYLSYDVLLFFEVQYLQFGVAYSMALNRPWTSVHGGSAS